MFRIAVCVGFLALLASAAAAAEPPRVYIEESRSWTLNGWSPFTGLLGAFGGGDRPQTVEVIRTFSRRCPQVTVTRKREGADFAVVLEREGGKGIWRKDNKYAVFNASGDLVRVGSTRMLSSAVNEACEAIVAKAGADAAGPGGPRPSRLPSAKP
jgi:hypothetical protein